jgi:hypothetical protein
MILVFEPNSMDNCLESSKIYDKEVEGWNDVQNMVSYHDRRSTRGRERGFDDKPSPPYL